MKKYLFCFKEIKVKYKEVFEPANNAVLEEELENFKKNWYLMFEKLFDDEEVDIMKNELQNKMEINRNREADDVITGKQ